MKVSDFTDEQILAGIDRGDGCGGRAFRVAERLGLPLGCYTLSALYRRLCRMEKAGLVQRCPRLSYVNSIYWRVVEAK